MSAQSLVRSKKALKIASEAQSRTGISRPARGTQTTAAATAWCSGTLLRKTSTGVPSQSSLAWPSRSTLAMSSSPTLTPDGRWRAWPGLGGVDEDVDVEITGAARLLNAVGKGDRAAKSVRECWPRCSES